TSWRRWRRRRGCHGGGCEQRAMLRIVYRRREAAQVHCRSDPPAVRIHRFEMETAIRPGNFLRRTGEDTFCFGIVSHVVAHFTRGLLAVERRAHPHAPDADGRENFLL